MVWIERSNFVMSKFNINVVKFNLTLKFEAWKKIKINKMWNIPDTRQIPQTLEGFVWTKECGEFTSNGWRSDYACNRIQSWVIQFLP